MAKKSRGGKHNKRPVGVAVPHSKSLGPIEGDFWGRSTADRNADVERDLIKVPTGPTDKKGRPLNADALLAFFTHAYLSSYGSPLTNIRSQDLDLDDASTIDGATHPSGSYAAHFDPRKGLEDGPSGFHVKGLEVPSRPKEPAQTARQIILGAGEIVVLDMFNPPYAPKGDNEMMKILIKGEEQKRQRAWARSALREATASAPIYSLDADASRTMADLSLTYFPLMTELLERARLPFPNILLEWDNHAALEITRYGKKADDAMPRICVLLTRKGGGPGFYIQSLPVFPDGISEDRRILAIPNYATEVDPSGFDPPHKGGWHRSIGRAMMVNLYDRLPDVATDPTFWKLLHGEMLLEPDEWLANTFTWGTVCMNRETGSMAEGNYPNPNDPKLDRSNPFGNPNLPALRKVFDLTAMTASPHCPRPTIAEGLPDEAWKGIGSLIAEDTGQTRMVLAALTMLNLRDRILMPMEGKRRPRSLSKKVPGPYLVEWNVRIKLPQEEVRRTLNQIKGNTVTTPKRRHDVGGAWCTRLSSGDEKCFHKMIYEDADHRHCENCGRKQWWRMEHARGDASIGYVRHPKYIVERDKKRSAIPLGA
jgi:hypothetical protein